MLLVLILAQVSIVSELYHNLDSTFTDQFVKIIRSLCLMDDAVLLAGDDEPSVQRLLRRGSPASDASWSGSGSQAAEPNSAVQAGDVVAARQRVPGAPPGTILD